MIAPSNNKAYIGRRNSTGKARRGDTVFEIRAPFMLLTGKEFDSDRVEDKSAEAIEGGEDARCSVYKSNSWSKEIDSFK